VLAYGLRRDEIEADFEEWKSGLDSEWESLRQDISARQEHYLTRYRDARQEELGPELTDSDLARSDLRENAGIDKVLEDARSVGPDARTEFERLLAQEGGDSARRQLGYYSGESATFQRYSEEQFEALAEGANISEIGPGLQRHHAYSVKANLQESPLDITPMMSPDNIRHMTREAHLKSSELGHGGNFQNSTTGEATSAQELYADVVGERYQDRVLENGSDYTGEIGLAAGLLGGSISAIVQYQRLRRKPWKRKTLGTVSAFASQGIETAGLSYAAIQTSEQTTQLISDGVQQSIEVGQEIGTDVTAELVGSAAGIEAAVAIRSGINFAQDIYGGRSVSASGAEFGKDILVVGGEELAFVLLGVAGDAFVPIPEPHVSALVNGIRVTYRLLKVGHGIREDYLSRRECKQKRLHVLRRKAVDTIPNP
jgi:hypothetical protein